MTIFSNSNCYFSFHCVILHTSFRALNFFNSVLVSTNLCVCECQIVKSDNTISIVSLSLKNSSVGIFQYETKFTIFKNTTCKSFSEVKTSLNWCNSKVVELCIFWHCNFSSQDTRCSIFSNVNSYYCIHIIVINVGICSSYFTYCVSVRTFFIVRNSVELDCSVSRILLSLDYFTIFKQFKCEGILSKLFTFKFLSKLELSLCCNRNECIVELCI